MAQIIPLPERGSRPPRRVPKAPLQAKILLFTGVRYERLDFGSDHRPKAGSKRAKGK